MADTADVSDSNSHNWTYNINGVAASNCENWMELKNHVHHLTLELESEDSITKLNEEGGKTTDVPELVNQQKQVSPVIWMTVICVTLNESL